MKVVGIIPARMASTRYPGKPLAKIKGLPMIEHVYKRSLMARFLDDLYVATCDQEIVDAVANFGGKSIMTLATHRGCTDRVAEAAQKIEADIILNIQGDEPLIRPEMLDAVAQPLIDDSHVSCTTLMKEITEPGAINNPNVVKVVFDKDLNALYFSREPIPTAKQGKKHPVFKQIGILGFRKVFLIKMASLPDSPLEKTESVDLLRCLENGFKVRVVDSPFESIGVDRPEDVGVVEEKLINDTLFSKYGQKAASLR